MISVHELDSDRFIPEYAGNTRTGKSGSRNHSVHPRVCGEHGAAIERSMQACGSSPRMRGTRRGHRTFDASLRFIPAYAGNTKASLFPLQCAPVHPRVCGEHLVASIAFARTVGSSPRMRGTRRPAIQRPCRERFIPAYAGNTTASNTTSVSRAVHPRVCGEHTPIFIRLRCPRGSSPRMRGTPRKARGNCDKRRFIPAYAGNTRSTTATPINSAVHPRVCGEHVDIHAAGINNAGSSPRMRGTRQE